MTRCNMVVSRHVCNYMAYMLLDGVFWVIWDLHKSSGNKYLLTKK